MVDGVPRALAAAVCAMAAVGAALLTADAVHDFAAPGAITAAPSPLLLLAVGGIVALRLRRAQRR